MRARVWSSVHLCLTFLGIVAFSAAASASTITLRSGNAPIGQPDPFIRYLVEPSGLCGAGFASAFGPAEFAAAAAGPNATVVINHPVWLPSLACDSLAQWIALDPNWSPRSALFAYEFQVPDPCCIQQATLDFCWAVDDWLGDLDTFTNPGVFLNGTALAISGGNFGAQTQAVVDVTSILHCGTNTLYVYDRDAGCAISAVIFSATLDIRECIVSVQPDAWGRVKSLYRSPETRSTLSPKRPPSREGGRSCGCRAPGEGGKGGDLRPARAGPTGCPARTSLSLQALEDQAPGVARTRGRGTPARRGVPAFRANRVGPGMKTLQRRQPRLPECGPDVPGTWPRTCATSRQRRRAAPACWSEAGRTKPISRCRAARRRRGVAAVNRSGRPRVPGS